MDVLLLCPYAELGGAANDRQSLHLCLTTLYFLSLHLISPTLSLAQGLMVVLQPTGKVCTLCHNLVLLNLHPISPTLSLTQKLVAVQQPIDEAYAI